jgi:nucleotide-binding universal stress UspA family protein
MNLTRIVCPIDFSAASDHAIEQAVVVAGYYKARIAAVHVMSPVHAAAPAVAVPGAAPVEEVELAQRRMMVAERLAPAAAVGVAVDVFVDIGQVGRPADRILERAAGLRADLIVMGTHGTSGFERLVLGSVTEKVLRKSTCPVLTVPPRAHGTSRLPFKQLLCAVDFSESSLKAVELAASLAEESNSALTLLHVLEWPWEEPPPPAITDLPAEQRFALGEFRRYSEASAARRLESLIPDSIPASRATARVASGKPYVLILHVAAEEESDLIVIGIGGRNPLDTVLFGSTTNQVVRRATCPVLTLRG